MKVKNKHIEFNEPSITKNEYDYIKDALNNKHLSASGIFTKKCNNLFEKKLGVKKSILTSSCTHALEAASFLININPKDEVIVPSFTFVSTANAFAIRGAKPVFIDIREDTLNMDEKLLKNLITENTKAIIPVHYAGVGCEMDVILKIARENNLIVIEDNAHGLFGKYNDKYLGTFGTFSTQSFHETKNISCGEGGALFLNDENYIKRAEIIMDKGTNRKQFSKNKVDKYSWVDFGSSFRLSDLNAAFLFGQLENLKQIQKKRKVIWHKYYTLLENWALKNDVKLPVVPRNCSSSYHIFHIIMPTKSLRNKLIIWLKTNNINSVFHYTPLHNSAMSINNGWDNYNCPVSTKVSERIIRLPMFYMLKIQDVQNVTKIILDFTF